MYSYYVVVGFYGYYLWSRKSKDDSQLRISDVNPFNHVYYILSSCVLAFSLAWFFNTYTDAERPYIDFKREDRGAIVECKRHPSKRD